MGTFAVVIKRSIPGAEVISIDGDERILEIARQKSEKANVDVKLHQCFASHLPFKDNYFDRALFCLFFHHLTIGQKIPTIKEVLRVLKPDGELHVTDRYVKLFQRFSAS